MFSKLNFCWVFGVVKKTGSIRWERIGVEGTLWLPEVNCRCASKPVGVFATMEEYLFLEWLHILLGAS